MNIKKMKKLNIYISWITKTKWLAVKAINTQTETSFHLFLTSLLSLFVIIYHIFVYVTSESFAFD